MTQGNEPGGYQTLSFHCVRGFAAQNMLASRLVADHMDIDSVAAMWSPCCKISDQEGQEGLICCDVQYAVLGDNAWIVTSIAPYVQI